VGNPAPERRRTAGVFFSCPLRGYRLTLVRRAIKPQQDGLLVEPVLFQPALLHIEADETPFDLLRFYTGSHEKALINYHTRRQDQSRCRLLSPGWVHHDAHVTDVFGELGYNPYYRFRVTADPATALFSMTICFRISPLNFVC